MRKKIISGVKKIDNNDRILESILYVLLMNYIRIIPYIQNNHVYSYIDQKLEETMELILNDNLTSGYNEKNNIKMVS